MVGGVGAVGSPAAPAAAGSAGAVAWPRRASGGQGGRARVGGRNVYGRKVYGRCPCSAGARVAVPRSAGQGGRERAKGGWRRRGRGWGGETAPDWRHHSQGGAARRRARGLDKPAALRRRVVHAVDSLESRRQPLRQPERSPAATRPRFRTSGRGRPCGKRGEAGRVARQRAGARPAGARRAGWRADSGPVRGWPGRGGPGGEGGPGASGRLGAHERRAPAPSGL